MGYMQKSLQQQTKLSRIHSPIRIAPNTTRWKVVKEAYTWIGTPFKHQGRIKGVGCDCVGLDIGIARVFGFDNIVNFKDYKSYDKNPNANEMYDLLCKYHKRIKISEALPGDWFHLNFIQYPQHMVMLAFDATIIHAYEPDRKVINHGINKWWSSRIAGVYRYIGLD